MVSSIGSSSSYAAMLQAMLAMQQQRQRNGPEGLFKMADTDASGGVSQAELTTLAQDISSKTGQTLKVDNTSFASYDADGSGALSKDELMNTMKSNGFGPPGGMDGAGVMGPSTTKDQAAAAYAANSGGDALSSLIAGLQNLINQLQSEPGSQGTSTNTAANTATESVGHHHHGGHHGSQDFFKKVDSDGSGGVSMDELSAMEKKLQDKTGQSITVNKDTFAAADGNGDGSLDADELKAFMNKSGFVPPSHPGSMAAASSAASQTGSSRSIVPSQKQIDLLQIMLEKLTKLSTAESTAPASLLNVSA